MKPIEHKRGRFVRAVAAGVVTTLVVVTLSWVLTSCSGPMVEAQRLEEQGDLGGAIDIYEQVLAKSPDDVEALSCAAVDLLLVGRFDDALPLQERLVALGVADVQTLVELGFNYLNHQRRADDAVQVLQEAVHVEPTAKNLTFLAQAQIVSGNGAGAEETLRQAIGADETCAHAYTVLVNLFGSQGRGDESAMVVDQAAAQGIVIGKSE
ncbi:MAG: tetratricopeptide repeat protein [Thermoleophilia bacterium]|nr:tetratricopeptide repeat protein [Thermoleophilia bacterium]